MALCCRAFKPGKMKDRSEARDLAQTVLVGMCGCALCSIGTGSRLRPDAAYARQLKGSGSGSRRSLVVRENQVPQGPISINLRIFGVGSLPRRRRRTQPGVLTPGKIQSNARPERALDVRVGYRVYCEPRNSPSQDDIRRGVSDLAAETWDAFQ